MMKEVLKSLMRRTPLYHPLRIWLFRRRQKREIIDWERSGRQLPLPQILKQANLRKYAKQYNLRVLVETGTFYGDMIEAMKSFFERIYSVELSKELFEKAKNRFRSFDHIELIHGDSGKELANVMEELHQPALFWLDAHYSAEGTAKGEKDTPICAELNQIFDAPDLGHVIIIDDARCFGVDPAYPTIEELEKYILSKRRNVRMTVEDDSIRITPGCSQPGET